MSEARKRKGLKDALKNSLAFARRESVELVRRGKEEANFTDPIPFAWGLERSQTGYLIEGKRMPRALDVKAMFAEMLAMTLFVILGCGSACLYGPSDGETRLVVALSFGMSILVLVYTIGHHSGGQINCAVTISLVLGGIIPWYQGLANIISQLIGSLLGAQILAGIIPCDMDKTTNLGTNMVSPMFEDGQAVLGEFVMTYLLCFVVWETRVSRLATVGQNSGIAIGFTVFIAHILLLPIDGCSINPTRSFGPAIVSQNRGCANFTPGGYDDMWIMWVGPILGSIAASCYQLFFLPRTAHHPAVAFFVGEPIPMPPTEAQAQALLHLEVEKAAQALSEQIVSNPELREALIDADVLPERVVEHLEQVNESQREMEAAAASNAASPEVRPSDLAQMEGFDFTAENTQADIEKLEKLPGAALDLPSPGASIPDQAQNREISANPAAKSQDESQKMSDRKPRNSDADIDSSIPSPAAQMSAKNLIAVNSTASDAFTRTFSSAVLKAQASTDEMSAAGFDQGSSQMSLSRQRREKSSTSLNSRKHSVPEEQEESTSGNIVKVEPPTVAAPAAAAPEPTTTGPADNQV
mmetsp:Transcript_50463/g.123060  ORF Transcript_50463/g.123060 Transcript_50463/m.123060 type:complete len:583 (-) Transcript_50463:465-2213(-)